MSSKKSSGTLWLTGRPCSGKSTLALRLKKEMEDQGIKTVNLDGDVVRERLNSDLGFSDKDRRENLRRVAHVAQLFNENGCFVIASFVSPTNEMRKLVRSAIRDFKLCFVKCSPEICEKRDVKGMYKKARAGKIRDFTGVDAPFEDPIDPEVMIDTGKDNVETCVRQILEQLTVSLRLAL